MLAAAVPAAVVAARAHVAVDEETGVVASSRSA
jgi:hypothetical protein